MRCNHNGTMNSWHSFSPNGRWMVFASKLNGPYTEMWLTHIDVSGTDSPAVLLEHFITENRAANIPEFVNIQKGKMQAIHQHIFQKKR
jgi:Tol biopolymer transport system component